ncbi:uncharacterized protein [Paramisgurnus dabryanus]|uniref:uncharacterized protein n=1 Tax=Paramisgurnus dabryanus TaxID=90735 RepID=UPI003CCF2CB1
MSILDAFFAVPSVALLAALNIKQLNSVAKHFKIEVTLPKAAKKQQLFTFIRTCLIDMNVLPDEKLPECSSQGASGSDSEQIPDSEPISSVTVEMQAKSNVLTFEQQVELLKLQHDLQMKQKTLELEQELTRKKLDDELSQKRLDNEMEHKRLEAAQKDKDRELEWEKLKNLEQEHEIERTRLQLVAEGKLGKSQQSGLAGMIKFLPKFNENDPDVFFSLFENIASEQNWSDEDKIVLLQATLIGRAQKAFVALPSSEKKIYRCVKTAVLKCYELIPEAYRQRFRSWKKSDKQTYAEWARDLASFFHRWLTAEGVDSFDELCDLMILEQLKNTLPDRITTYISEHHVKTAADAAVLADNFSLIHKTPARDFSPRSNISYKERRYSRVNTDKPVFSNSAVRGKPADFDFKTDCNYCFGKNHWKKNCPVLVERNKVKVEGGKVGLCASSIPVVRSVTNNEITLTKTLDRAQCAASIDEGLNSVQCDDYDFLTSSITDYAPFITEGFVALVGDTNRVPVKILRDTGASESFICQSVLPFSSNSDTGNCVLIRGIGLQSFPVPLHKMQLFSGFVSGEVTIAVRPSLPIEGIDLIVGNNLAHDCVFPDQLSPSPVVKSGAVLVDESDKCQKDFPDVFMACAVTRAMAHKQNVNSSDVSNNRSAQVFIPQLPVPFSRSEMSEEQKSDQSLQKYFDLTADNNANCSYLVKDDLLLRRWAPTVGTEVKEQILQVVLPEKFREIALKTAHCETAGHFGVKKTYNQLLKHYYWPRIKRDVARFVRTCHVCQVAGKQNAVIKPAPLQPIQSVGKPFEHLIIDCVGPLPQSKSGCVYLFTIMCQATRYPAAYALRTITTRSVVKALSQFISVFGLPRIIQSDQGSNFTSKTFAAALKQLRIQHNLSSAYHAQSQGVLERFHATLKSLLRTYCIEMKREWEDGLPWLMLAARAVVQESTGYSPNELVFGHNVSTPLSVLSGDLDSTEPPKSLSSYVHGFRRRLFLACKMATENLTDAQRRMKQNYDRKAEARVFGPGDQVLALLPIPGSPFSAKYSGPYSVVRQVSETNYVIATPDRRKATQLCHINLLKPYYSSLQSLNGKGKSSVLVVASTSIASPEADDDVQGPDDSMMRARLNNSETLTKLEGVLRHLDVQQQTELKALIFEFPCLFSDTPTCTKLIEHDIEVGDAKPIRQRFYRTGPDKRKSLDDSVQYLLDNGLAVQSYSSWASPCLLVKKSDHTYRFCTDYRKVNSVTKPDSYPLPRIEDCVDQVGAARYVSKFDLLKGYYQVPLTSRAQEISAFITASGLYSYTRMAFGMRNAPSSFQRLMNRVVAELEGCAVYIDDVVCYSDTWEIHLARIRLLFERFAAANLTVNLAKCEFAQATVVYLGKVVGQGNVRPVRAKVLAIDKFPRPVTKKELMRFLGMIGYYRNFCCNFSSVVAPLTNLLRGSVKFNWTDDCQRAFENAKSLLTSAPVLAAPRLEEPFQLQVDASQVGAGAVLLQKDENEVDRPVSYFSRKFNRYQFNYSTIEKEALALIWALQHFEVYVGGGLHPVVVFSDHNPLTFLSSLQNTNQRLMRWALFLQPYNLSIRHIKGSENVMADALSRALDDY